MRLRKTEASWVESAHRWQINVQVDGVRRTFTCATPGKRGKAAAERKADTWLENQTVGENTKCGVMLDKYIERLKVTTSKSNWHNAEIYVNARIRPVIGERRMSQLTEQHLQTCIDLAYVDGLSARTLRNIKAYILAWLKYCRKARVTTLHPEDLQIPTGARKTQKSVATPEDIRILFSHDQSKWHMAECFDHFVHAYRFACLTGLRPGELLALRWSDVAPDGLSINIKQAFNDVGEFTAGKNDNARRTIVLGDLAAAEVQQQREYLKSIAMVSEYVFPARDANVARQPVYRHAWNNYKAYNGISNITPYEMRHTFVSATKEMPEGLKKMVVGHSKDMDTEGTYGHEMDGDLQAAAGYTDAAFRKILSGTH